MHQLMKYEPCRPLRPELHLPLDARVFLALRNSKMGSVKAIEKHLFESPYRLEYRIHQEIQDTLRDLVNEMNARPKCGYRISSRIELNLLLWV